MKNVIKKMETIVPVLLAIIILIAGFTPSVYAYEKIDMSKPVTLAVQFTGDADKVPGMPFKAYRIASVDENVNFTFTSTYAGYGIAIPNDQAGYRAMAETLSGYIARDGIAPDVAASTDENGRADFGTVEKGLYLILANRYTNEATNVTYFATPTLVAVPNSTDGNSWIYDVVVSPKYTSIPPLPTTEGETIDINVLKVWSGEADAAKRPTYVYAELICDGEVIDTVTLNSGNNWRHTWTDLDAEKTYNVTEKQVPAGYTVTITRDGYTYTMNNYGGGTPPVTPPNTPRLPQTGQLWWPIPVLVGAGLASIIAGVIRKKNA